MRLVKEGKSAMKILFVDSGIGGIAERYAYDIFHTLRSRFVCTVERVNPRAVTPETFRRFRPNVLLVVHGTLMRSSPGPLRRGVGSNHCVVAGGGSL